MKRNFILASHGYFAEGIKTSLDIIYGKKDNVYCICAYTDKDVTLKEQIDDTFRKINKQNETIIITDVFGGSVNNEFLSYLTDESIHLIAGLNLPLLIELIAGSEFMDDTKFLINNAIESCKSSIQYCNDTVKSFTEETDEF
jgi:fructoselysine and glucoselysine-specific PTS system IIA component